MGTGTASYGATPANWSDGSVPGRCQDVVVPSENVTVPAGFQAVGKTLDVVTGAILTVQPTGLVDVHN